jgi:RNA polymerase sigma-70 factor (ECF subfamily)
VSDHRPPGVRRSLTAGDADRELARAYLAARDEAAFRALYRRHAPALWRMALRLSRGAEEEARDVMQETWIRAAERLDTFRWESSLRTWLISIALNCSRERIRRERRQAPGGDADRVATADAARPSGAGAGAVEPIDLTRAIDALPDGYRRVLVLHDLEGYTHEEIGRLLGVEAGTSKSQLHRARASVRARLASGEGGAR